jgi:hypothetical protein
MRFKFFAFFVVLFTVPLVISCFSQFKDFRTAIVIKSNGDSLYVKVNYQSNFDKRKTILIKKSKSEQEIPVSELDKIILSTGEVYTVIALDDSTQEKVLAKTFVDGSISLYKAGKVYYLRKDTSIFKLDDHTITVKRDGKEYRTSSKKYLSSLHIAFMDCQTLDYEPLANKANLKALTNLIYQYGKCKNIAISSVARRPTLELVLLAGPSGLNLNSSFINRSAYNSGNGFSYGLSFLKDLGSSNRFKMRLDLNYLKSEISGSFTVPFTDASSGKNEYTTFSTTFNGFRLPIGFQYYLFNNSSSLYISTGILLAINKYDDFDANGYFVYNTSGKQIYEPSFQDHFEVTKGPIAGLWCAIGGDIRLDDRFKLNIEMRAIRTVFDVYAIVSINGQGIQEQVQSVRINEFNPSLGLKYRLR